MSVAVEVAKRPHVNVAERLGRKAGHKITAVDESGVGDIAHGLREGRIPDQGRAERVEMRRRNPTRHQRGHRRAQAMSGHQKTVRRSDGVETGLDLSRYVLFQKSVREALVDLSEWRA